MYFSHVWAYQDHNLVVLPRYFSSSNRVKVHETAAPPGDWDPPTLLDRWGARSFSATLSALNHILGKPRSSSHQRHLEVTQFSVRPDEQCTCSDTPSAGATGSCVCACVSQPLTKSGQYSAPAFRVLAAGCPAAHKGEEKKQWQLVKIITFKHASYIRNN